MHEAYDNNTFQNDIAILKTSQPVKFSKSVQPFKQKHWKLSELVHHSNGSGLA
jgi:hypothetical protein